MRTLLAMLALTTATAPAGAQQVDPHAGHQEERQPSSHAGQRQAPQPTDPHAGHGLDYPPPPAGAPPEPAFSGPRHAADLLFDPAAMADARRQLRYEHGGMPAGGLVVERLETQLGDDGSDYAWDAQGWYGGDIDRLWIKTEGEQSFGEAAQQGELQALWSHAFTPWFDLQAGLRYDWRPEPERAYVVLGVQGLMPYRFELDAALFLSDEGDASARFEAGYDLLLTQRLVLQPRAEVEVALREVPELRVGSGIGNLELGLRLRYEVAPELAPYAGIHWERRLGETADLARRAGAGTHDLFMVAGVKFWF